MFLVAFDYLTTDEKQKKKRINSGKLWVTSIRQSALLDQEKGVFELFTLNTIWMHLSVRKVCKFHFLKPVVSNKKSDVRNTVCCSIILVIAFGRLKILPTYRAFHEFWQAEFSHGNLVLGSSPFCCQVASKTVTRFKSGQNWLKIIFSHR